LKILHIQTSYPSLTRRTIYKDLNAHYWQTWAAPSRMIQT
jgi:hypothetical protein